VRVALFCFGSRGDSEPLAALATALCRAGHEACLVTSEAAHRELEFEAYEWNQEALSVVTDRNVVERGDSLLLDYTGESGDDVVLGEKNAIITVGENKVPEAVSEALIGALVPSTQEITVTFPDSWPNEALRGRTVSIRVSLKRLLARPKAASAPVAASKGTGLLSRACSFTLRSLPNGYRAVVRAMHYASTLFFLPVFGREAKRFLPKHSLYWPSLVDFDMFWDAWKRSEWRIENPVSEGLVLRWYAKHGALFDSGSAFRLVYGALAGADRAVIAAGADHPGVERLILHVAANMKIPCFRVNYFPDDLRPKTAHVSWLAAACFPIISALSYRRIAGLRNFLSYLVAAPLYAGFLLLHRLRDSLATKLWPQNAWLAALNRASSEVGWPATTWNEVARADYVASPVFTVHSATLLNLDAASGAWSLEPASDWTPPAELAGFLEVNQEHPVLFFAAIARDWAFQHAASEVLRDLPNPAIFNFAAEHAIPALRDRENAFFVESVPHRWLFPKVAVAVHHGGSGHVHAALRAKIPSVVVPGWGDQYLWADRVWALQLGPAPIPHLFLTEKNLRRAIESALTDQTIRRSVERLSAELAREPGAEAAVAALEKVSASAG
jgi:hypothetical protein